MPPTRESSHMPRLHHHRRGQCHEPTPLFLSADGLGTPVALCRGVSGVAKPPRASSTAAHSPQHVTTPTRQGASPVWRLDAPASLCPVRPSSDASHAPASGTPRSDATAPPPPTGHRHREALLSSYGLCLPRLVGAGQPARQRPSQRGPVASMPLDGRPRLLSRAARPPVPWPARLGRPHRPRARLPRRGPGPPRDGAGQSDPHTGLSGRRAAADQRRAFAPSFLPALPLRQGQLAEWSAGLRALKASAVSEDEVRERLSRSPPWVWGAVAPESTRLLALDVGDRPHPMAPRLVHQVAQVLAPDCAPLCLPDGVRESLRALLPHEGQWVPPPRWQAPGPAPQPRWRPRPQ